jgi:hypothetical protein
MAMNAYRFSVLIPLQVDSKKLGFIYDMSADAYDDNTYSWAISDEGFDYVSLSNVFPGNVTSALIISPKSGSWDHTGRHR